MRSGSMTLKGYLRIFEHTLGIRTPRIVFDQHNTICNEGLGRVMDWLSGVLDPGPIQAIVLSNRSEAPAAGNTFAGQFVNAGGDPYISHEGVLRVAGFSRTSVTHAEGSSQLVLAGTLGLDQGNDTTAATGGNIIRSVGVVMGVGSTGGDPGGGSYVVSGEERLLARTQVGELVKTSEKTYSFSWSFQISIS